MSDNNTILLSQLPIRESSLHFWHSKGYTTRQEILKTQQALGGLKGLAQELELPLSKLLEFMAELQPTTTKTAADILLEHSTTTPHRAIITFHANIDRQIFNGGIKLGHVWEVAGPPGVGKTQFLGQLSVNARLPKSFGGVQGKTIYIDTEGSVVPERIESMAKALVSHVHSMARKSKQRELPEWFTVEEILKGILTYRVHDLPTQLALIESLDDIVQQHSDNIKLIVIDSIAFHYRASKNTGSLTAVATKLAQLASKYNLAVVCVNHMTTKRDAQGNSKLTPSLGESWAHAVAYRIQLNADHTFELTKAPDRPPGKANYTIRTEGFRENRL